MPLILQITIQDQVMYFGREVTKDGVNLSRMYDNQALAYQFKDLKDAECYLHSTQWVFEDEGGSLVRLKHLQGDITTNKMLLDTLKKRKVLPEEKQIISIP